MIMSGNRNFVTRRLPLMVFGGIAALGALVVFAQVNPQVPPQRTSTGPALQNQNQPQNQNQVAPTSNQPANQAARDPRAIENSRQPARTDQADVRQRQSGQSNEQDTAWLGVFLRERDGERGATIAHVYPSGPAARAGLYPGDVIQQINGQQVTSGSELVAALEQMHPGDKAEIIVLRNNEPTKLTATLGSRDSFVSRDRWSDHYSGRGGQAGQGQGGQYDENEDLYNIPLHAMELEHNRRMAEQHQRIETEIAKLREEVRQLREALQRR
jgi:C-terminal processing protease CtpA/Prc